MTKLLNRPHIYQRYSTKSILKSNWFRFKLLIVYEPHDVDAQYVKIKIITCYVTALLDATLAYIHACALVNIPTLFFLITHFTFPCRFLFTFNHRRCVEG